MHNSHEILSYLTVGVKNSTRTTSKPAVVLISTLVPGAFLLCGGLVTALIVTVVKLKRKIIKLRTKATEHKEEVVEYASTLIIPVNRLTSMPPSLPQTPPPSVEVFENMAYGWSQFSARNALTASHDGDNEMGSVH